MSGIVYPVGPQQLKIPTTTLHPSTSSPFNPSTINVPNEVNWNAIKALEDRGLYKTTFDACRPPYPAGGSFYNSGAYALLGTIQFLNTFGTIMSYPVAHHYARSARMFAVQSASVWTSLITGSGDPQYQIAGAVSSTNALIFEFDLPNDCTIVGATVRFEPNNAHAALPAVMPKIEILMADNTTGNATVIGTVTDATATFGLYNLPHAISGATTSTPFNAYTNSLYARVYGESGAGSEFGFVTCIPIIAFDRTSIGEEFGDQLP